MRGLVFTGEPEHPRALRMVLSAWAVVGLGLMVWAQLELRSGSGYLFDLYPLYRGAEALLEGRNAYDLTPPSVPMGGVGEVGNSYPIHAVLILGVPLVWLPPSAAVIFWTLGVGAGWMFAVRWAGESPYWFLWVPMWQAILIQQPSAALSVAAILAFGALRHGSPWVLAICTVLLTAKPQQFLVLALVLAWWGRAWWRQIGLVWGATATATFLAQPDWVPRWWERVSIRSDLVPSAWLWWLLIPAGIVLAIGGCRAAGLAVASSGIGPWPAVGGYYMSGAWPIGLGRSQSAAFALIGILGFVAGELAGASWAFAAVAACGTCLVAVVGKSARRREVRDPTDVSFDAPGDCTHRPGGRATAGWGDE